MRDATREIRLASALVEVADTLVEGFEATRYLQRVSDHCVELLGARAAGVMLIDWGRSVSLAASSRYEQVALDPWSVHAGQAFMALRQYARRHRLPLDQVASAVIEGMADDAELRRESDGSAEGPA